MTRAGREQLLWTLGYVEALVRSMAWVSAMGEAQLALGATVSGGAVGYRVKMAGVTGVVTIEDGEAKLLSAWIAAAKQALGRELAA